MAKDEKAPAYQWYPKDADSDEAYKLMSYEQQGVYRALLDHQWLEGSLPTDPTVIARLLPKITIKHFLKLWPGIAPCFREEAGRLVNPKLEDQRTAYAAYRAEQKLKGQRGADRRWNPDRRDPLHYSHGHAPAIVRPSPEHGGAIVLPMPNDSSPSASATATPKQIEDPSSSEALMTRFRAGWKKLYGYESSILLKPLEFSALQQQLAAVGFERMCTALAAYFTTTEDFVRKAKHPLGLFLRDPLRFLASEQPVHGTDQAASIERVRQILKDQGAL